MKLSKIASEQFGVSIKVLMKIPGVPAKTMFAIRGIAKIISEEVSKYEEMRASLAEEFGERDAGGQLVKVGKGIKISESKLSEMKLKLKDMNDLEVSIPEIKFSDLGENPALTAEDIYQLEFIVE